MAGRAGGDDGRHAAPECTEGGPISQRGRAVAAYRRSVRIRSVADLLDRLPWHGGGAVVRDGADTILAVEPSCVRTASGAEAFAALDELSGGGFWTGYCAYDLGREIERIRPATCDDLGLPDVAFARFDARIRVSGGDATVEGDGRARSLLEAAVTEAASSFASSGGGDRPGCAHSARAETDWHSSLDRDAHAAAVARIQAHLQAGDCYQVNLTRRLDTEPADPVALFRALTANAPAPHAALLVFGDAIPGVAVVSASPELFLRVDGREVETRPIKGTGRDAAALAASAKDRAENVMIVDLARNDLGRVCEYGSVRVDDLCAVERHPGLYHLVSTIRGRLRAGVGISELVRATFPPASVTGAPKPRVLQIIEELEPVRRGVYCGALGWIDADRDRAELAVAIRTFTLASGRTYFGAGGGIVADSCAPAEWAETELKGARLLGLVTPRHTARASAP